MQGPSWHKPLHGMYHQNITEVADEDQEVLSVSESAGSITPDKTQGVGYAKRPVR